MSVNKERVRKLVEALRSGEYKQGRNQLKKDDSFCCLGVACDVVKDEVEGRWNNNLFSTGTYIATSFLPFNVAHLYGTDSTNFGYLNKDLPISRAIMEKYYAGSVQRLDYTITLNGLNDHGATFNEIADVIEEQFLAEAK